jgi:plasmid maintenance system antidote protein VapI
VVERHGLSVTDAAAQLHVTRQAMSGLLGGRGGLSAEMAIRFEKAFGLSADTVCGDGRRLIKRGCEREGMIRWSER